MTKNVFEIRGLDCAYRHNGKTVLTIKHLDIPQGKITTILGKSGSGKSTLVETLGMMNNTIKKGFILLKASHTDEKIDQAFWKKPNKLSRIRKEHFSFIFQNDYLMPYYSPIENIIIGNLIQNTYMTKGGIVKNLEAMLEKVYTDLGIDKSLVQKHMPYEMSGGQKQRLSFIRAITKDYTIIIGDEPTGNLDDDTSEILMNVLKESVREGKGSRSAILVSHNIKLSIDNSDRIIVLSPGEGTAFQVQADNVFDKEGAVWTNRGGVMLNDEELTFLIKGILRKDNKSAVHNQ